MCFGAHTRTIKVRRSQFHGTLVMLVWFLGFPSHVFYPVKRLNCLGLWRSVKCGLWAAVNGDYVFVFVHIRGNIRLRLDVRSGAVVKLGAAPPGGK